MNRIIKFVSFLALPIGTPALSQVSTHCTGGPGFVHCNTYDYGAVSAQLGNMVAVMKEKSLRAKLGKMVATGDCQGAATYALQKGRFDIVRSLKQFCGNGGGQVQEVAPLVAPVSAPHVSSFEAGQAAARAALASHGN